MKVRIKTTPREQEVDGVNLDRLTPGVVREVSTSLGAWLVAEGYAEPQMRNTDREEDQHFVGPSDESPPAYVNDRRAKRPSTFQRNPTPSRDPDQNR